MSGPRKITVTTTGYDPAVGRQTVDPTLPARDSARAWPWRVVETDLEHPVFIFNGDERVAEMVDGPETRPTADRIIRQLNAHEDLIWAAKDAALCIAAILARAGQDRTSSPTLTHLMRAIKQAERGQ